MLPTRDPPQERRPTKTEREGVEKKYSKLKERKKKARVAKLISDKIDFKKSHKKRHRRSLYNTQRNNPPRRHKHCKYIYFQLRSTQIHKENLGGLPERY